MKKEIKAKTKKFLSLLTVSALVVSQIPAVFANDPVPTAAKTLESIDVVYNGSENSIEYNTAHEKQPGYSEYEEYVGYVLNEADFSATLHYSNGETVEINNNSGAPGGNGFGVSTYTDTMGPVMERTGWNKFKAYYDKDGEHAETDVYVWGYQAVGIEAKYTGEDVFIPSDKTVEYDTDKVEINLVFSPHHTGNGENWTKKLDSGYTLGTSKIVSNIKDNNVYDVSYQYTTPPQGMMDEPEHESFSTTFKVWGYKLDSLEAKCAYNTAEVGHKIAKEDVTVTAHFTPGSNETVYDKQIDFTLPETEVKVEGDNKFTANTEYGPAYFHVLGTIAKIEKIEAEYVGGDVRVGKNVDKNDVNITLVYDNGQRLPVGKATRLENTSGSDPKIATTGYNKIVAVYETEGKVYRSEPFNVWGYEAVVTANYNGPKILKGQLYDKENVVVSANWTERKDKTSTAIVLDKFEVNSLKVNQINENTYTATAYYEGEVIGAAPFTVIGYEIVGIDVEYEGDDMKVGGRVPKDKIKVRYVYSDGTKSDPLDEDDFEVPDDKITSTGDNELEVVVEGQEPGSVTVWGYGPDHIEVKYNGEDVFIGEEFDENNLTVTLYYTNHKDGSPVDPEEVDIKDCTITNKDGDESLEVTDEKNNKFTITYEGKNADVDVWGYTYDRITAEYVGDPVRVGEPYSKEDVVVTVYYTQRVDDSKDKSVVVTDFTVDNDTVYQENDNTFTATFEEMKDNFVVTGFVDEVTITSIDAEYVGPDILVDDDYKTTDIKVTIHYSNSTSRTVTSGFSVNSTEVKKVGDNTYTVTLNEETANITVWGYKAVSIKAKYNGPDIYVGDQFDASDVSVEVTYTPLSTDKENYWTGNVDLVDILNSNKEANPTVTDVRWNYYTVMYKGLTGEIQVWGYKLSGIEATYNGPNVFVGNTIRAKNITVNLVYTPFSNGIIDKKVVDISLCVVSAAIESAGLKTWKTGNNEFVVTYNGYKDSIEVWGYTYDHITADYVGDAIRINEDYNKSDVNVNAYYTTRTDNGTKYEVVKDFDVNSTLVKVEGLNEYIATFKGMTDTFTVTGFDDNVYVKSMKAKYVGPDILVGNVFDAADVIVEIAYTDGTTRTLENGFEITPFEPEVGPVVPKRGWNDYTVTYQDMTDEIQVWGYELDRLEAVYNGPAIYVGNNYAKEDVVVTAIFSPFHDGTYDVINVDVFDVDSLLVTVVGDNTYTATCEYGDAPFVVPGLESVIENIDNIFTVIALDKDGNNVDGVIVKYSTNGHQGTLTTGDNDTAQIGIGTVITVDDCTIIVPAGYDVDTTTMDVNPTMQNTTYVLTITLKDAENITPVEKTSNVVVLVAVDKDLNSVDGVSLTYSTNGYKGILTTGGVNFAEIGIGTVITLDDCIYGIPEGYTFDMATINADTDESHTVYTITVVVTKDTAPVDPDDDPVDPVKPDDDPKDPTDPTDPDDGPKCPCEDPDDPKNPDGDNKCDCGNGEGNDCGCGNSTNTDDNNKDTSNDDAVNTPQTDDESNAMLYMTIGGLALVIMLGLLVTKKKEEDEEV